MKGMVKFFNEKKGFGFIDGDDGKAYFIHISGVINNHSLEKDDSVIFGTKETEKGLAAFDVEILC